LADQENVFVIAGYPSCGKTFMGDYMATRGWAHVDGDLLGNEEATAMGANEKGMAMWGAMQKVCKGESCERAEWLPYYELLIELGKKELKTNKNVVITYAVFGIFGGERELFKQHFKNVTFINVKVDRAEMMRRFRARQEIQMKESGMTMQMFWDTEEMADARAQYGETYT
jgi:gluconate kinase